MIPIGPGDIAKAISAVGTIIDLIKRPERANNLKQWADLLGPEPKDESKAEDFAHERMAFLVALTQDLGFTPWYVYGTNIIVPKDLMCDLIDLLIMGPTSSKQGWLQRLFGGSKKPKDDFEEWADLIAQGKDEQILDFVKSLVARNGRTRHYEDGGPAMKVDKDWFSDAVMALLNQA